jgi:1-acyl-sn-glycerol-3-phosphate acyltransferase
MRRWGGISVNRAAANDVVSQTIDAFAARPQVFLVITPEGTRKKVSRWKTGFWHIAKGAGVPILPIAFDWGSRVVRIQAPFMPRTNVDEDVQELQSRFAGIRGRSR